MGAENRAWQLEDFVDSLVVELDKTRETLAVKAINKPLTYTVKELALDLNIFPTYDGEQIAFTTAQPGQAGASKVTIQLGSITDQQVRATTKISATKDDTRINDIDLDKSTKKQLRKLGVTSVDDIKQIERRNVDLAKASENFIDYKALANQIQKSRRAQHPPRVKAVSLSVDQGHSPCLVVQGENLAMDPQYHPVAVLNSSLAEIISGSSDEIRVGLGGVGQLRPNNELVFTLDPYSVVRLNVKS